MCGERVRIYFGHIATRQSHELASMETKHPDLDGCLPLNGIRVHGRGPDSRLPGDGCGVQDLRSSSQLSDVYSGTYVLFELS